MPVRVEPFAAVLLAFCLTGCEPAEPDGQVADNGTPPVGNSAAASALEALALESGVISGQDIEAPAGAFGAAYAGGTDRLCVLPVAGDGSSYRFGVEVRIGEEEFCRGTGTARWTDQGLSLDFAGARCTIEARYEGDRIAMPGTVENGCAALCSSRASLAGTVFTRSGAGSREAARMRRHDGKPLCEDQAIP